MSEFRTWSDLLTFALDFTYCKAACDYIIFTFNLILQLLYYSSDYTQKAGIPYTLFIFTLIICNFPSHLPSFQDELTFVQHRFSIFLSGLGF